MIRLLMGGWYFLLTDGRRHLISGMREISSDIDEEHLRFLEMRECSPTVHHLIWQHLNVKACSQETPSLPRFGNK